MLSSKLLVIAGSEAQVVPMSYSPAVKVSLSLMISPEIMEPLVSVMFQEGVATVYIRTPRGKIGVIHFFYPLSPRRE